MSRAGERLNQSTQVKYMQGPGIMASTLPPSPKLLLALSGGRSSIEWQALPHSCVTDFEATPTQSGFHGHRYLGS